MASAKRRGLLPATCLFPVTVPGKGAVVATSFAEFTLKAEAGGCFCERFPEGSIEHGRVLHPAPGRLLRLQGSMGPLQSMPVIGILEFAMEPAGDGTRIPSTYRVGGHLEGQSAQWAPAVDQVFTLQLQRLGQYLNGNRSPGQGMPRNTLPPNVVMYTRSGWWGSGITRWPHRKS